MSRPPLRVEIGALVLHGVSHARGRAIATAIRSELTRLLSSDSVMRQLRGASVSGAITSIEALNAGRVTLSRQERPERTGQRLAQKVVERVLVPAEPNGGAHR